MRCPTQGHRIRSKRSARGLRHHRYGPQKILSDGHAPGCLHALISRRHSRLTEGLSQPGLSRRGPEARALFAESALDADMLRVHNALIEIAGALG